MKLQVKNFNEYLAEAKQEQEYDYGCAMLHFDFPEMQELHDYISEEDIYTEEGDRSYGLEKDPHVTLLYGLHEEVSDDTVKKICLGQNYGSVMLENISCFENEKFDVLKFDVKADGLHDCNAKLAELPHTTEYPDYHPHATVGYLKSGTAQKYIDKFKDRTYEVTPHSVEYSKPSGDKLSWKLKDI